jgi:hypothetical protein
MEETPQVRASWPAPPDHYKLFAEETLDPPPIPDPGSNPYVYGMPIFGVGILLAELMQSPQKKKSAPLKGV